MPNRLQKSIDNKPLIRVYASVWADGVYRSRDGGENWEKVLAGTAGLVSTLVVNPAVPNVLYAALRQEGIYSTIDGGDNWLPINGVLTDTLDLAIDPVRPNILYASTLNQGIHKSTDGGLNWSPMNAGLEDTRVFSLAISRSQSDTIYAGTVTGVYKSTNGGANWTQVDPSVELWVVESLAVDPTNPNRFYAGTRHEPASDLIGGVYRSVDGGNTLSLNNQGLLQTFVWSLASSYAPGQSVADPATGHGSVTSPNLDLLRLQSLTDGPASQRASPPLYAGTWGGGVFRSMDGGLTWEEKPQGLLPYVYAVEVAPSDPNIVYAGTFYSDNGVYQSTDGGDTWVEVSEGLEDSSNVIFSLAVDPTTPDRVYAGTWDGVFRSIDGGAIWMATTGLPVQGDEGTEVMAIAINPKAPHILYAATYGQGVYKSTNSGETWFAVNGGLPVLFVFDLLIDPQQPDILYAATSNRVYKSENGGATWKELDRGMPQEAVRALTFDSADPRHIFAGTHSKGMYWSMDRGEHWAPLKGGPANPNIRAMHVALVSDPVLYAGTNGDGAWAINATRLGKVFVPLVARNFRADQAPPAATGTATATRTRTPTPSASPVRTHTPTPTSMRTPTPTPTSTSPPEITVYPEVAWTTDEANQTRMGFITLDTIRLWMWIINNEGGPVNAYVSWEVRGPGGFRVDALSWSGSLTIDPEHPGWNLERQIPTDLPSGQYTFTGSVAYAGQTTTQNAAFYLADDLARADDFSDPDSGWPTQSSNPSAWELGYVDDTYRILVKVVDQVVWSTPGLNLTDYVIELDTWQVSSVPGESGFLFGLTDDRQQYYAYSADNQGRYRLRMRASNGWTTLLDWTATTILNTGQAVNHLMVVRQGTQIVLYANGQHLATVTDGTLAGGRLGVSAGSLADPNADA